MRQLSVLVFLLGLGGCGGYAARSPESQYRNGESPRKQEKLPEALAEADAGFRVEPSWRFRLLKAKILTFLQPQQAIEILRASDLPNSPELRARAQLCQGWAKFLVSD